jgi:hypothetical protein
MRRSLDLTITLLSSFLLLVSLSNNCFSEVTYKLKKGSNEPSKINDIKPKILEPFEPNSYEQIANEPKEGLVNNKNIPKPVIITQEIPKTQNLDIKNTELKNFSDKSIINNGLSLDKIDQSRFMNIAQLQGLNKINAKVSILETKIGEPIKFGNLIIIAHKCWQAPINQRPDSKILVEIFEVKHNAYGSDIKDRTFYGWLIASDLGVSALEHPIYDISALSCKK